MLTRRGITLLEVLISMFILLIGLLGVGAMIPAARHEILAGVKTDYATTISRAMVREMKVRSYLRPGEFNAASNWLNATGGDVWNPDIDDEKPFTVNGTQTDSIAFVIDPLGIARGYGATFPYGASGLSLYRIHPNRGTLTEPLADPIFRCSDDLITEPATGRDMPPTQRMMGGNSRRASVGNYSWLATITPDPAGTSIKMPMIVTVVVFYKRDLSTAGAGESSCNVTFPGGSIGSEITLDNPAKAVRPGDWLMLCGVKGGAVSTTHFRWIKVVGAATVNAGTQDVTLAGEWDTTIPTTAWLFENVIATATLVAPLSLTGEEAN
jgi:hypothetical protein